VRQITRRDVVIVGGGLLGLSTAWALRGLRDVLVLERDTVGNARGGSHGPTRIFRLGYVDPSYVEMALRAARQWRILETETGVQLLHPTPQLTFGPEADAVSRALEAAGAPAEHITASAIAQRFPTFSGRGDALLETSSAVITADRTLATLRRHCGAEVREHARVERVDARQVETATGRIDARTVVVCAGPWTRSLIPSVSTTSTLEHVGYVRAGPGMPIFVDFADPVVYGVPTPGSDQYKIAVHHGGSAVDPDAEFTPDAGAVATLHATIAQWIPDAELIGVDTCPYDDSPDEQFIVRRVEGIVVGAGTSGHAFKFGPLLGQRLAQLVQETT
jgi:sarcosine oxidase